ncbi:MAG: hypothetical protein PHE56_15425 [Bacteroidales bacterium]|nr:hypothetical protein [Bacteroidales bacterium]
MLTIKLRVNESIANHLFWFLSKFNNDEIEIIEESAEFIRVKNYLTEELRRLESGEAEVMSVQEADIEFEKTIKKYES